LLFVIKRPRIAPTVTTDRATVDWFRALHDLALQTNGLTDPIELAQAIVAKSTEICSLDYAMVVWLTAENQLTIIADNAPVSMVGKTVKPGEGMSGPVFETGKPLIVGDYSSWSGASRSTVERLQPRSAVAVPLRVHDRTMGLLSGSIGRIGALTTEHAEILTVVAAQVAPQMEVAWLFAEVSSKVEQLQAMAKDLERSNRDLESFAYVASHDLQEPLRTIAGYLEILNQDYAGQIDAQGRRYLSVAADGATRMSRLLSDVLEYSRVGQRAEQEPVDTDGVVRTVLTNLEAVIHEKAASIDVVSRLPVVSGSSSQLTQLFQNLVGNALKFSGDRPRITVSAAQQEDGWLFSVADSGIGIPAGDRERIFDAFQRLHNRDQYPGTGLGLALCKRIVESHGGRIWVESQAGAGSTFHFTLPRAA
jgi:signal transduction histidine kinase